MTAADLADRGEPPAPAITATASELSAVCIRLAVVTVEHPADTADHLELAAQAAMLIGDLISRLSARLTVMDLRAASSAPARRQTGRTGGAL